VEPWWKEGRTEIYQEIKFIHIGGSMTHILYKAEIKLHNILLFLQIILFNTN
jgi:hypothetical protein